MAIQIYPDYDSLSLHAASEIAAQLTNKPESVLCLAAGDTPRLAYRLLANIVKEEKIDCSKCTFVGLDEWLGIPPESEGSCHHLLRTNLFEPLSIKPSQVRLFDAMTDDPQKECERMDAFIREKGGIDLMMVGVGMNGHIGFNEPGVSPELYAHVVDLDETTKTVGQKYFSQKTRLQKGITLGFKHFLESRRVIMIASGRKKARVVRDALEKAIMPEVPATVIRKHKNGVTMLDEDAASRLTTV